MIAWLNCSLLLKTPWKVWDTPWPWMKNSERDCTENVYLDRPYSTVTWLELGGGGLCYSFLYSHMNFFVLLSPSLFDPFSRMKREKMPKSQLSRMTNSTLDDTLLDRIEFSSLRSRSSSCGRACMLPSIPSVCLCIGNTGSILIGWPKKQSPRSLSVKSFDSIGVLLMLLRHRELLQLQSVCQIVRCLYVYSVSPYSTSCAYDASKMRSAELPIDSRCPNCYHLYDAVKVKRPLVCVNERQVAHARDD